MRKNLNYLTTDGEIFQYPNVSFCNVLLSKYNHRTPDSYSELVESKGAGYLNFFKVTLAISPP